MNSHKKARPTLQGRNLSRRSLVVVGLGEFRTIVRWQAVRRSTNVRQCAFVSQPACESAVPTATILMPEEPKARIAAAAKRSGAASHGFILEAISAKADQEKLRADLDAVAEDRYAHAVFSGRTISWHEMRG